jgi:hypothetical protein
MNTLTVMPVEGGEFVHGKVLATSFREYFPDGMTIATADGGRLWFKSAQTEVSEEEPPFVGVNLWAAVKPLSETESGEYARLFRLTTALVDGAGQLWERSRIVTVAEVWKSVLEHGDFYLFDPVSAGIGDGELVRSILLNPVDTICDMREHHLVEVVREQQPGGKRERLVFRLRFKYFGAKMGLMEERRTYQIGNTGKTGTHVQLKVLLEPNVLTEVLAVFEDGSDNVLPRPELELPDLGVLWAQLWLTPDWKRPGFEKPVRGDMAVWRAALEAVGVDVAAGLKANEGVNYEEAK